MKSTYFLCQKAQRKMVETSKFVSQKQKKQKIVSLTDISIVVKDVTPLYLFRTKLMVSGFKGEINNDENKTKTTKTFDRNK